MAGILFWFVTNIGSHDENEKEILSHHNFDPNVHRIYRGYNWYRQASSAVSKAAWHCCGSKWVKSVPDPSWVPGFPVHWGHDHWCQVLILASVEGTKIYHPATFFINQQKVLNNDHASYRATLDLLNLPAKELLVYMMVVEHTFATTIMIVVPKLIVDWSTLLVEKTFLNGSAHTVHNFPLDLAGTLQWSKRVSCGVNSCLKCLDSGCEHSRYSLTVSWCSKIACRIYNSRNTI